MTPLFWLISSIYRHFRSMSEDFCASLVDKAGDVPHFCVEETVLVIVRLIDIEPVYAQLLESDHVVLAGAVLKLFQLSLQTFPVYAPSA
jgi:hypothetical protein